MGTTVEPADRLSLTWPERRGLAVDGYEGLASPPSGVSGVRVFVVGDDHESNAADVEDCVPLSDEFDRDQTAGAAKQAEDRARDVGSRGSPVQGRADWRPLHCPKANHSGKSVPGGGHSGILPQFPPRPSQVKFRSNDCSDTLEQVCLCRGAGCSHGLFEPVSTDWRLDL